MRKRTERKPPKLTARQRHVLMGLVNALGSEDGGTRDPIAEAILVALGEISAHRRFRKERSKRR